MSRTELKRVIIFLLILTGVIIFFGSRKLDYHIDEIANYGLANHVVGKDAHVDIGKMYTGLGPYEDFVEVKEGQRFNYRNVFHNQWEDVHPPLYYSILHTVCSFFPDSFSKWYGIGLNIFWMWCTVFVLYKLFMLMTNNSFLSMGILIAYGTTAMLINTILFIRMYAQLTFVAVLLAYLLKVYWDKQLNKKFYIAISAVLISGMLTQYYFLFFAFPLCLLFVLHLFFESRVKEIFLLLLTVCVDALAYLVVWRHIIKHIFGGYRGEEAMSAATSLSSIKNLLIMTGEMYLFIFCGVSGIFSIILIVVFAKKLQNKAIAFTYEYALVYTSLFYLFVVGMISPYQHFRYISPVAFIFVYAEIVVITNLLKKRLGYKKAVSVIVALCVFINFVGFAFSGFYVEMDFYTKEKVQLFADLEDKVCVVYLYEDWVLPEYFEALQHAKSYVFIDSEHEELVEEYNKPGYVWAVHSEHSNNLPKEIKGKCIYTGGDIFYEIE